MRRFGVRMAQSTTTTTTTRTRWFAPLGKPPGLDRPGHKLEGVVFDVDGTLWWAAIP